MLRVGSVPLCSQGQKTSWWELTIPFHHVGFRDWIQITGIGSWHRHPRNRLAGPHDLIFNYWNAFKNNWPFWAGISNYFLEEPETKYFSYCSLTGFFVCFVLLPSTQLYIIIWKFSLKIYERVQYGGIAIKFDSHMQLLGYFVLWTFEYQSLKETMKSRGGNWEETIANPVLWVWNWEETFANPVHWVWTWEETIANPVHWCEPGKRVLQIPYSGCEPGKRLLQTLHTGWEPEWELGRDYCKSCKLCVLDTVNLDDVT